MDSASKCSKNIGRTCDDGAMCGPSRQSRPTNGKSISSAAGSPAKTLAMLVNEQESTENEAGYGSILPESFAFCDPGSLSLRTSQRSLFGGLIEFCATLPKCGLMRSGSLFRLPLLVPAIFVKDFLSLPHPYRWTTPQASRRGQYKGKREIHCNAGCRCIEEDLASMGDRGPENPTWREWLMGFPAGWTDLNHSATPSSRKCPNGLDGESSNA